MDRVMGKFLELSGQRFGRLTAIGRLPIKDSNGKYHWYCQCDCAETVSINTGDLTSGKVKSCGCLFAEQLAARNRLGRKEDADRRHPLWKTYVTMKQRCYNLKANGYPQYGGRGITICDRWVNSFRDFVSDVGVKPDGKSLDRIDNDGNYEPSNCRWATPKEQANNRRIRH